VPHPADEVGERSAARERQNRGASATGRSVPISSPRGSARRQRDVDVGGETGDPRAIVAGAPPRCAATSAGAVRWRSGSAQLGQRRTPVVARVRRRDAGDGGRERARVVQVERRAARLFRHDAEAAAGSSSASVACQAASGQARRI
jgi:hypothetical protein